jgi:hypothetical protein
MSNPQTPTPTPERRRPTENQMEEARAAFVQGLSIDGSDEELDEILDRTLPRQKPAA